MTASPGSLRARLFWAFAVVTVVAAALPALYARHMLYESRVELAGRQALVQASLVRGMLEAGADTAQLEAVFGTSASLSFRMTLTDRQGRVMLDSHIGNADLSSLDNHADRPEIEDALARGAGISLRHSNSLDLDAVYAAVPLQDGGTLRVAVPLEDIRGDLRTEVVSLGGVILAVAGFCLLLSALVTGWVRKAVDSMAEVVASISRARLLGEKRRLHEVPGREFLPLAYAVNHMADTIEAYLATTTDQQSQLETILDNMEEGVLVLGPGGNIRRWNRALADMFPAVIGAEGGPLIQAVPDPALQRLVQARLKDKSCSWPQPDTAHLEMPDGRFLVAHVSIPWPRNDSVGAVIVLYDATDIMRLERVRKDFVSNVSHELRTPLTAITGYAETLMTTTDLEREELRRFAEIIHRHAHGLARVIEDLMALARVENTRDDITLESVDAENSLREALEYCQEQARAGRVQLKTELRSPPVLANPAMLTQVFRNLLENAIRYSPAGAAVNVRSQVADGEALFIVSDAGPGIPQADLPRIFERFYQVKKERNSGTSGIGLAICKHIIERHHGRIWAESPYQDAATAMLFTLPLAPLPEKEVHIP